MVANTSAGSLEGRCPPFQNLVNRMIQTMRKNTMSTLMMANIVRQVVEVALLEYWLSRAVKNQNQKPEGRKFSED
jgi:hypothetical protein